MAIRKRKDGGTFESLTVCPFVLVDHLTKRAYQSLMSENNVISPQQFHKSPATDASRAKSRQVSKSIRSTLAQAADLKDLAYQTAMEMKGHFLNDSDADLARAKAQAITQLTRSWAEACDIFRFQRGKPLPGSLRPETKSKRSKAKPITFMEEMPA
jgi:hypothetical protein